jgi:molybdopterin-binding protein
MGSGWSPRSRSRPGELGLSEGTSVTAVIKASDVILAAG